MPERGKKIAYKANREGVAEECLFTGYGLADLWADLGIIFVLGPALYRNAIHGGKAKHDQIDSQMPVMMEPP